MVGRWCVPGRKEKLQDSSYSYSVTLRLQSRLAQINIWGERIMVFYLLQELRWVGRAFVKVLPSSTKSQSRVWYGYAGCLSSFSGVNCWDRRLLPQYHPIQLKCNVYICINSGQCLTDCFITLSHHSPTRSVIFMNFSGACCVTWLLPSTNHQCYDFLFVGQERHKVWILGRLALNWQSWC